MTINAQGGVLTVRELLQTSSFQIPDFQRNYAWTSDQVLELWGDIEHALDNDNKAHFIGSILLKSNDDGGRSDVIDGQQRLTTLFIALCRLRDAAYGLDDYEIPALNPEGLPIDLRHYLDSLIVSNLQTGDARFYANDRIRGIFYDGIIRRPGDPTRKNLIEINDSVAETLRQASILIEQKIDNLLNIKQDQTSGPQKFVLLKSMDVILDRLQVLKVTCDQMDEAIDVYMTMNSTGLNLLASDLIKSLLIKYSNADGVALAKWNAVVENVGDKSLDQFLRYYLLVYGDEDRLIRKNEVYKKFETLIERANPGVEAAILAAQMLEDLVEKSEVYGLLLGRIPNDGAFEKFDVTRIGLSSLLDSYRSLFLILLDSNFAISPSDRGSLILQAEGFVVRWLVCKKPAQTLEKLFQDWARILVKGSGSEEACEAVQDLIEEHTPSDDVVHQSLKSPLADAKLARFILFRVDERLGGNAAMVEFVPKRVHVEHIAPQSRGGDWPQSLGVRSVKSTDGKAKYDALIDLLGNKVILDYKINNQIKDSNFLIKKNGQEKKRGKKVRGYVDSVFPMARDLQNVETWEATVIHERTAWIADCLVSTWPVKGKQMKVEQFSKWISGSRK